VEVEIIDNKFNMMKEKPSDDIIYPRIKKIGMNSIIIFTKNCFFKRLWFLISNPFYYLFAGKIRY